MVIEFKIVTDGDDRSVLVKVYQKHPIEKDKLVRSLTENIGGILGKLKDGGTKTIIYDIFH